MTAMSNDRDTSKMSDGPLPGELTLPIKGGQKLYSGSIAVLRPSDGYVYSGANAKAGDVVLGCVNSQQDATGLADGALNARVFFGAVGLSNSATTDAITNSHIGRVAYLADDQTFALTDGGNTRPPAGVIVYVDPTSLLVFVEVNPITLHTQLFREQAQRVFGARCVATANVALATGLVAGQVIDGVTLAAGDRVLLAKQTTASQNGLYVATTAGTASYAPEWVQGRVRAACIVEVSEGTAWKNSDWRATAAEAATGGAYTIGTTDPLFYPRRQQGVGAVGTQVTGLWLISTTAAGLSAMDTTANHSVLPALGSAGQGTGTLDFTGTGTDAINWQITNW